MSWYMKIPYPPSTLEYHVLIPPEPHEDAIHTKTETDYETVYLRRSWYGADYRGYSSRLDLWVVSVPE